MTTITIPRPLWLRGSPRDPLLNEQGQGCAVGHILLQLGCPANDLLNRVELAAPALTSPIRRYWEEDIEGRIGYLNDLLNVDLEWLEWAMADAAGGLGIDLRFEGGLVHGPPKPRSCCSH